MTDNDTLLSELTDESSRRSFMKKSAIASGGLAVGLSGAGTIAAQDGTQQDGNVMRGLMFNSQFHPRARFQIISESIDWAPVETDENDFLTDANDNLLFSNPNVFGRFNTRVINYQIGRQSWGLLFVHESADVQQGQTYELSPAFSPFGTDDFEQFGITDADDDLFANGGNELGLVTVQFSPAGGGGETTQAGNQTVSNETAGNATDVGN